MSKELTVKQRTFVEAYLQSHGNGVEAAKAAGYKGNSNTLAVVASENLRKPKVQAAIARHLEAAEVTEEKISKEISVIAFGDAKDDLRHDHKLKSLQMLAKIKGMMKEQRSTNTVTTMQLMQVWNNRNKSDVSEDTEQVIMVQSS